MAKRTLLWIIYLALFILGAVMAYQGWQALSQARILVEWTTASELNTVGYNLYRSEDPDHVGERINRELIPSSSDPLTGGVYEYEDRNLRAGRTYYYSLEEVENNGTTTRAGTIEVTAGSGGWWDIGLAVLLFGVVLVGWWYLASTYRIKPS